MSPTRGNAGNERGQVEGEGGTGAANPGTQHSHKMRGRGARGRGGPREHGPRGAGAGGVSNRTRVESEKSEGEEDRCLVCLGKMEVYSVGECNHPVCYVCSTRMRVLCQRNECAICRRDLPKVIYTTGESKFELIKDNIYPMDRKFKICFETEEIQNQYARMLEHKCPICEEEIMVFKSFRQLDQHIRREHELYYCELCVNHLKLFTHERKCYTRKQLVEHRRKGDPEDTSFKGHPLCEFCDQRFIDNEELYKHLRKDHYFCHFCDADGLQHFYSEYNDLKVHFRKDHFLCEEPECEEKKFVVFRTEIDLKGHNLDLHSGALSKAASKEARKVELDFQYTRREPQTREDRVGRGGRGHQAYGRSATPEQPYHDQLDGPPRQASEAVPDLQADFPSLFAAAPTSGLQTSRSGEMARMVAHNTGHNTQTPGWTNKTLPQTEDFPSLPGAPKTVIPSSAPAPYRPQKAAPVSKAASTHKVEAFPGLGPPAKKPGGWAGVPAPPPARHVVPRTAKVAPAPVLPSKNQKKASTPVRRPPQSAAGLRVIDRRIPDSDEEDFPSMEQPDIALNNFSKLTVKNSGQDLSYSRDEASSNIKTVDRSVFEAQQAAQNSSASSKSKPDLKSEAFPGLGAPERKLEFPVPGNKKKTKNSKNVPAVNYNSANTTTVVNKIQTASANSKTGSSSLSSICDFLGGNDKKVEEKKVAQKPKEEKTDWETADSQGKKEKTADTRNDIKPIVSKVKAPAAVEEVYRPSKVKKNHGNEETRDMRPTSRETANDDFPSLDGSSKKLGANFVKAEDKIFKPKVTPSQWDQNEIKIRMTESVSEEPEKTHGNVKERRAPPGFTKDFPTLGVPEVKKPPPGFGNPRNSSTATSGPPPGFGPKNNRSNHKYTPPENFEARNSALITTITGLIGGKSLEFKTFKEISGQFRRGQLNSDSYFTQCRALVSKDNFDKFFPELVVLLPDITMQGELLELYLKSEGKAPTLLRPCSVCQQVSLVGEESDYHNKTHSLDLDFPRL